MSEIFVFAGSNGSGKSTLANRLLSSIQPSPEFVNADIIAARLNPDDVDAEKPFAQPIVIYQPLVWQQIVSSENS